MRLDRHTEQQRIKKDLGDFDAVKSSTFQQLQQQFGANLRHTDLRSIALVLIKTMGIPTISRNERRSFPILVKWFDRHWTLVSSVIGQIELHNDDSES
jgi:hypothetical protein